MFCSLCSHPSGPAQKPMCCSALSRYCYPMHENQDSLCPESPQSQTCFWQRTEPDIRASFQMQLRITTPTVQKYCWSLGRGSYETWPLWWWCLGRMWSWRGKGASHEHTDPCVMFGSDTGVLKTPCIAGTENWFWVLIGMSSGTCLVLPLGSLLLSLNYSGQAGVQPVLGCINQSHRVKHCWSRMYKCGYNSSAGKFILRLCPTLSEDAWVCKSALCQKEISSLPRFINLR